MRQLKGSCLCRAIEYVVDDEFQYMGYCHCSESRKFSGSASSISGGVAREKFHIVKGSDCIKLYPKTEATLMAFCQHCGSSLYTDKVKRNMIHVRLGTLDDTPTQRPNYHVMVGSKAEWEDICDSLPQFEDVPAR